MVKLRYIVFLKMLINISNTSRVLCNMKISDLFENDGNTMTLWHGGRGLEFSYNEMMPHKKGRLEHGPGLYLTTHYDTAFKYAKGGGKVYSVTIRKGTPIDNVVVTLREAMDFVKRYAIKKFQSSIISDLEHMSFRNVQDRIKISAVVNLCLNYDALRPSSTVALRQFLIKNGADYEISPRFGGRDETIVILFNPELITSVKPIKAAEVDVEDIIKDL